LASTKAQFLPTSLKPIKAQYSLAFSKTQYPLASHEDQYSLAHSNQYPFKAQYSLANTKPNLHWHPKTNLHWQLPEAPIFNGTYQAISISIDIQNPIFIGAHPKPNLHWNSMLNFHWPTTTQSQSAFNRSHSTIHIQLSPTNHWHPPKLIFNGISYIHHAFHITCINNQRHIMHQKSCINKHHMHEATYIAYAEIPCPLINL
jgi:hypothetical protein